MNNPALTDKRVCVSCKSTSSVSPACVALGCLRLKALRRPQPPKLEADTWI